MLIREGTDNYLANVSFIILLRGSLSRIYNTIDTLNIAITSDSLSFFEYERFHINFLAYEFRFN